MPFGPLATAGGGGGAPDDAQYVVMVANATLAQERILTGTANRIVVTDFGAGAAVTLSPGALIVQTDQVNVFTVGPQTVETGAIGNVGLIVQLAAGVPAADSFQIKDSGGTVFSGFDERGILFSDGGAAGAQCLIIGSDAGRPGVMTGEDNTYLGNEVGRLSAAGASNTGVGSEALFQVAAGNRNSAFGWQSAFALTSGNNNFALGAQALLSCSTGSGNVALGYKALERYTGNSNVGIGIFALQEAITGARQVGLGALAGIYNETGADNVFVGYETGAGVNNSSNVAKNTGVGTRALKAILTGADNNTTLGYWSGTAITTGAANVLLGYLAGSTLTVESNRLYIANTNTATPLVYGEFDNHIFRNYASTAVTAAVQVGVHRLAHVTSGVAAPLFGISATHELEDGGGVLQTASEDATLWAVATAGSEQPLRRWTNYPNGAAGPGYGGYITADDVDNVALTIIPNGAGDVTVGLEVVYFVSVSDGNTAGGNATCLNGGNVVLYNAGGNTLTLAVAADGSATLQRTADAGAGLTYDCSLWLVWV